MMDLQKEIEIAINCASRENESDTPDFILAEYLMGCLRLYETAIKNKDKWNNPYINTAPTKTEIKEIITPEQEDLFAKFKKEKPEILHTDTGVCVGEKEHRINRTDVGLSMGAVVVDHIMKYLRRACRW